MNGGRKRVSTRCRYEAARREAIYTAERLAATKHQSARPTAPPSRRQIIAALVLWALFLLGGLWLAAHDPEFLSRAAQRAIGGAS